MEVFRSFTVIRRGVYKSEVTWREREKTGWTEPWKTESEFKVTQLNWRSSQKQREQTWGKRQRKYNVKVLVFQSCLILCDPMDCSPPDLCPCDSPGKDTEVGCHLLLQGIFPTQGLNLGLASLRADSLPQSHQGSPKNRHHFLGTPTGNMASWDYNSYECPWEGMNFLHKVNQMKHNCQVIQISPSKFQASKLIELIHNLIVFAKHWSPNCTSCSVVPVTEPILLITLRFQD